jgi:large subunit ribosomal protein L11
MDFCKAYNAQTESQRGTVIPVEISIYEDRTFDFITKTPPAPVMIREAVEVAKGSQNPGREEAGTITQDQLAEIAKVKLPDLNTDDIEAAKLQIAGTARSMGVRVVD